MSVCLKKKKEFWKIKKMNKIPENCTNEYDKLNKLITEFNEANKKIWNAPWPSKEKLDKVDKKYFKMYMDEYNATEAEAWNFFHTTAIWISEKKNPTLAEIKFAIDEDIENYDFLEDEYKTPEVMELYEELLKNSK